MKLGINISLILLCLPGIFLCGCGQKTVIVQTGNDSSAIEENVESLGEVNEVPKELVQQYMLASIDTIDSRRYIRDPHFHRILFKELKTYYRLNDYNLVWSTLSSPTNEAKTLLNQLALCEEHGLFSENYQLDELVNLISEVYIYSSEVNVSQVIHLDIMLSAAYITYAWHLYNGQIEASDLGEYWHSSRKHTELSLYLADKGFKEGVRLIIPKRQAYDNLRKKLAIYLSIEEEGGWPLIPDSVRMYPGESHELIYLLRERLFYTNDYKKGLAKTSTEYVYGPELQNAVSTFQKRHGLAPDGLLNKETIAAMNVSVEERVDQIKINLERFRWLPDDLGDLHLLVNIPEFMVKIYKKEKLMDALKVIVGKADHQTPILHDQVEYITFSPSWSVPDQAFNRKILPKVKENPEYLDKIGYRLYARSDVKGERPLDIRSIQWKDLKIINNDYRAVHPPGPNDNIHGQIKFAMPNSEDLFLCDASTTSLFDFSFRAFNYSSISVEKPELLAKYLLNDRKWDVRRIKASMSQHTPESTILKEKTPVHVVYFTAWVDDEGVMQFRDDIYGYDIRQAELMQLEEHRWLKEQSFIE
ncbi:L,D-transpeptidase family protein [Fulvivirga sp. M361]|uniref:L,D-transpeptidase family protein n=1 Tax=Fulvivirga sp. M361 TaxID=2594266 RepID=UPI00117B915E|nr:L,D-transpeptidase family protein [Fulvivirga sp. M361]TRX55955.1 L,D-transpeptidase family protein [Fulvivirga sp. M361]